MVSKDVHGFKRCPWFQKMSMVSKDVHGFKRCPWLQWCHRDLRCKKLQLTDLLVSPVHHIMKIPLVKTIEI
jgi:hypothetical protein